MNSNFNRYPVFVGVLFSMLITVFACVEIGDTERIGQQEINLDYEYELLEKARTYLPELHNYTVKDELEKIKIKLGRKLFHEKRLSRDKTFSCATCHNLTTYGVDGNPTSRGVTGRKGTRNAPTVLNASLHIAQFWDGRSSTLEHQAREPILNPIEMAMPSEAAAIERIKYDQNYQKLFAAAFPNSAKSLSYENLSIAIAAFEESLQTRTRFDDYLSGDLEVLNKKEKEGLDLFLGNCKCHFGSGIGGNMYQKFGLFDDYWNYTGSTLIDKGRMMHTGKEADKYVFKVPGLRNVGQTAPYFHDGSVKDLKTAVEVMGITQLNREFTNKELDQIVSFLHTLTAEEVHF